MFKLKKKTLKIYKKCNISQLHTNIRGVFLIFSMIKRHQILRYFFILSFFGTVKKLKLIILHFIFNKHFKEPLYPFFI